MKNLSRRTFTKISGMGVLGGLVSHPAANAVAQESEGAVLRYAVNAGDILSLDPHYASGEQDRAIVDMVFSGLMQFTPGDSSTLRPDLAAETPTNRLNDDGSQTWTFQLRSGVMTHAADGVESYELTTDDLLFSFEKAANAESSGFSSDYIDWTFSVPEDGVFEITVPQPLSETLFLPKVANYSGGYIIPRKAYEAVGGDGFVSAPIGTGPFRLESYTPQQGVRLVAHDEFYRGTPKLGAVEIVFLSDTTSREFALQSGDVDLITGLPEAGWVERMDQSDGLTASVFGVADVIWINLDTGHEILKDPKIREAIFLAISREDHAALFGAPISEPSISVTGDASIPGSLTDEEAATAGVPIAQDVERSKELLAEAGYADGFTLDLVSSEMPEYRQNYEVLAEELRQVGITVNLEVVQHASMHELIREGRNAIVLYIGYRPNASVYLTQFFSTDGGVTNFSGFKVDDILKASLDETDAEKQVDLWKEANLEILTNYAAMGLMVKKQACAMTDSLDLGHELISNIQYYPGIDETTTFADE